MSEYAGAFTTPEVNGTFNAWCGNCNAMTDQGNGIWATTIDLMIVWSAEAECGVSNEDRDCTVTTTTETAMMTAMNAGDLPPAMVRSGRVELWLETALPDERARETLLRTHLADLPEQLHEVDLAQVVANTEGFSGADLLSLLHDAKILVAYDDAHNEPFKGGDDYFATAIRDIAKRREAYERAEQRARESDED